MRVLVLGAGRMGLAGAWDIARQPGVECVRLVDRNTETLRAAERELARLLANTGAKKVAKIEAERFDLEEAEKLPRLLRGWDVLFSSSDYRYNEMLTRAAIEAKCHMCDLGGNLFVVEKQMALDDEARRRGVTIIPDCGLAPGMACLLAAWGVEQLDSADSIHLRVGGLPAHPKPPLNYALFFNVRGLTNEYLEPAERLRDGQVERIQSLTEVESLEFPAPFGQMEAFNTSGGCSTLPRTLKGRVRNIDYKTIRYPGHCAAFAGMLAVGLLSSEPVDGIVPLAFTEKLLERAFAHEDTDVVLVRVIVEGKREGRATRLVLEIIDRHDDKTGHSAMARTTSYPTAVVAYMLGAGAIEKRGVLPGELAVPLDEFVSAVRARGIEIQERWESL